MEALERLIGRDFEYASDMASLTSNIMMPIVIIPDADKKKPNKKDEFACAVWDNKVARYIERQDTLKENLRKAYTIVWSQCSKQLQSKLKENKVFKKKHKEKENSILWGSFSSSAPFLHIFTSHPTPILCFSSPTPT